MWTLWYFTTKSLRTSHRPIVLCGKSILNMMVIRRKNTKFYGANYEPLGKMRYLRYHFSVILGESSCISRSMPSSRISLPQWMDPIHCFQRVKAHACPTFSGYLRKKSSWQNRWKSLRKLYLKYISIPWDLKWPKNWVFFGKIVSFCFIFFCKSDFELLFKLDLTN